MAIMVRKSGGDFVPCPAGTWPAVCVDVIDLGPMKSDWKDELVHKIRLVWQVSERMPDGRPYIVQRMYTASLHEKSSLRKDLSSWRGMDFKPEELAGFDLENVLGVGCLLSVMQQTNNDGQVYANVIAVMRLPQGYEAPAPDGYTRTIHRDSGLLPAPARQPQQGVQQKPFGRLQTPIQTPNAPRANQPPLQRGAMQFPPPQPNQQVWQPPMQPPPMTAPVFEPPDPQEISDDDVPF